METSARGGVLPIAVRSFFARLAAAEKSRLVPEIKQVFSVISCTPTGVCGGR